MVPWFERPVIYHVRARPHLVESTSGSRDLQMKNECRWAFRLDKVPAAKVPKDKLLMRDVDYHVNHNNLPRHSSDSKWSLHPLLLSGCYISGSQDIPEALSAYQPWVFRWPERIDQIKDLRINYRKCRKPSVRAAIMLYTDEVEPFLPEENVEKAAEEERNVDDDGKDIPAIDKPEKSSKKKTTSKHRPLKRKRDEPLVEDLITHPGNSSSQAAEVAKKTLPASDELDVDLNAAIAASFQPPSSQGTTREQLGQIFSNSFAGVLDSDLANMCKYLGRICESSSLDTDPELQGISRSVTPNLLHSLSSLAGRASYKVTSELESRFDGLSQRHRSLKSKVQKLEEDKKQLEEKLATPKQVDMEVDQLRKENKQLQTDLSSATDKIADLEKANSQLYDVYNLSEEAILLHTYPNSIDDETLLDHFNSSLNSFSNDGVSQLSLEDLRAKFRELEIAHRNGLSKANKFRRDYHASLAKIKQWKADYNELKESKEKVQEQGAEALAEFQERVITANRRCEILTQENQRLRDKEIKIRSQLVLESEDEFNWAASVLDRARNNLAIDVSLINEDTALVNDLIHEREASEKKIKELEDANKKLAERRSLYKRQLAITVKNEVNHLETYRNQAYLEACRKLQVSPSKFPILQKPIAPDTPSLQLFDSDDEEMEEESEEEEEEEELEENEEEEEEDENDDAVKATNSGDKASDDLSQKRNE